ncbi:BolA/IbaG family iron-sulfur metabolism protein [Gallaecimonas kandeliae]|uniref:BolA family protein n=1 Tax=Gallaecimonas kandeliae TaxID=3029055 RepID=UPI00264A4497|nr:BolA/IbaG family iron-sulfur metabolism protein [Gallaecimonas kandeliae]WKE64893.1 BolA/IbaG family iron-sulfur metabolism protein [Gallaecimonas kandeliae]
MSVQRHIEDKLHVSFQPAHLAVTNESHMHAVPKDAETHFKVVIVSAEFEGQRLVSRHRAVNQVLADELAGPVHALALHTYTEAEWEQYYGQVPASPACLGGSKLG